MTFKHITPLAAALLLGLVACENDNELTVPENISRTLITDAPFPFDRVARVDLYVVSVFASLSSDTSSSGQFVTLASPRRRINLLALQNGVTDLLGVAPLPVGGAITSVRMMIDTDSSSITLKNGAVLTGKSSPGIAWQSSAGRPTLNALIHEQITVPSTGAEVVIDFDVGKAFIPPQEIDPSSTDQGFIFSPVLRAADGKRTGSIGGTVRALTAGGAPIADAALRLYLGTPGTPENTWSVLQTGKTASDGSFTLSYVTTSAHWATLPAQAGKTYILAVDAPASSGGGHTLVPNLTVSAGQRTSAGTIVVP